MTGTTAKVADEVRPQQDTEGLNVLDSACTCGCESAAQPCTCGCDCCPPARAQAESS